MNLQINPWGAEHVYKTKQPSKPIAIEATKEPGFDWSWIVLGFCILGLIFCMVKYRMDKQNSYL